MSRQRIVGQITWYINESGDLEYHTEINVELASSPGFYQDLKDIAQEVPRQLHVALEKFSKDVGNDPGQS